MKSGEMDQCKNRPIICQAAVEAVAKTVMHKVELAP
jgi:hypothetical protein